MVLCYCVPSRIISAEAYEITTTTTAVTTTTKQCLKYMLLVRGIINMLH